MKSLQLLIRRAERFASARAQSADEQQWAARFLDGLDGLWQQSTRSEAARLALEAVDRRVDRSRKTPMSDSGGMPCDTR